MSRMKVVDPKATYRATSDATDGSSFGAGDRAPVPHLGHGSHSVGRIRLKHGIKQWPQTRVDSGEIRDHPPLLYNLDL